MTSRQFDIGTAIFYFFKRFGENPGGAIWIALCQAALVAVLVAGAFAIMIPAWENLVELVMLEESGRLSEEEAVARVFAMMGPSLIVLTLASPVAIVCALMFQGAWLRFLTHGEVKPGIPFRIGGDEIRLLGVNLLYIALAIAAYAVVAVIFVVTGVGAAFWIEGSGHDVGAGIGAGLMMMTVVLAVMVAALIVAVKLASAPAMSVRERRFRFFESWSATKGVFWHMLVSYAAVAVMMLVISTILGFFVQILLLGAMWPLINEIIQLDMAGGASDPQQVFDMLGNYFSHPGTIAVLIAVFLAGYAVQIALEGMWHGVGAYNAVRNDGGESRDLDAPTLEDGHPMGSSPSEG
ncbi:hypothetical protein [Maricaulis sp.]|uniref:hypothetical protein n=1 Tax=Maricaulis sp. TaxID=1486257 RepID=UPI00261F0FCB|nr:hypothetical protein [Maricaulis sp.]